MKAIERQKTGGFFLLGAWLLGTVAGCTPLREGYEGLNLAPLLQYSTHEERDAVHCTVLWPFFEYSSQRAPESWQEQQGEELRSREVSLFPLFFYRDSYTGFQHDSLWHLTGVYAQRERKDVFHGGELLSSFSLVPLLLEDVFSFESRGRDGETWRLRCLLQEYASGPEGSSWRLLDLFRGLPLASLAEGAADADFEDDLAASLSGSEWRLLNVLGFRLLRGSSRGGFREYELLTTPLGESTALARAQWSKEGFPDSLATQLAPLLFLRQEEDSSDLHLLWPLYSRCREEGDVEQRWFYFLRSNSASESTEESSEEVARAQR